MFRCEVAWKENGTRHDTRRACSYLSRFRRRASKHARRGRRIIAGARRKRAAAAQGTAEASEASSPRSICNEADHIYILCARPAGDFGSTPRKFSSVLVYPPIKKWDLGMIPGRSTYPGGMCLPVPDRVPRIKSPPAACTDATEAGHWGLHSGDSTYSPDICRGGVRVCYVTIAKVARDMRCA